MNVKKYALLAMVLLFIMVLAACGQDNHSSIQNEGLNEVLNEVEETDNTMEFPITIVDGSGVEKTIEQAPESIVSLMASNTEIAFALGLGDRVVGVSDFCNYPQEVNDLEKLGGQDFNTERILEILPDLLLISQYHFHAHEATLEQLEAAGITVITIADANSFEEAYQAIELIGQVGGAVEKAEQIISDMKEGMKEIQELVQNVETPKRVFLEVGAEPEIYTTGQQTFMHEMLELIHAENIAGDLVGWVSMTEEEIVERNPEVILITYGGFVEGAIESIYDRAGWAGVPAITDSQVFEVDNDSVTRPGPRLLDGVEDIARKVYPEIFE